MESPLQHPQNKVFVKYSICLLQVSTCKMQECDDFLDHINKVKVFADQLACLEVFVRNKDISMTLLENLPPSYEYLITGLETMLMKELTMEYAMAHLMHVISKKKGNKNPKMMMSQWYYIKAKWIIHFDTKMLRHACYYCGKLNTLGIFTIRQRKNSK